MSPRSSSTDRSRSASSSGATSSVRTSRPSASRRRARWRPRKPAPPVIAHTIRVTVTGGLGAPWRNGPAMRRLACAIVLVLACPATAAAARVDPQVAGLQVALRAYGLYTGAVDGVTGPKTVAGVKRFQRRAGLQADGKAGVATRRALGPLGRPLFGRRTLQRGLFGWDVS